MSHGIVRWGGWSGAHVASDNITILVGTTKGAFLISGGSDRTGWTVTGPHCDGWPINHLVGDAATGTIWAGGGGDWHGAGVWHSDDGGESWQVTRLTKGTMDDWAAKDPDFAKMIGWDRRCSAFRRWLRADLVALPSPWPTLRRHQAS